MVASSNGKAVERPRVGLWLGLLLLFVPIFYPLLFFKPYSWLARLGWGGWLGLIVFVKVAGLSEPVIDLTQLERQVRIQEQQGPAPASTARSTFVQPDTETKPAPPLADYLRELGGGVLGRRIADYHVDGDAIRIRFEDAGPFLPDEGRVSEESIGAALSLFYGRDFRRMELHFVLQGKPLRVALTREQFAAFFGMSEADIRAVLADPKRQDASVFRAGNLPPEKRADFFKAFAAYE